MAAVVVFSGVGFYIPFVVNFSLVLEFSFLLSSLVSCRRWMLIRLLSVQKVFAFEERFLLFLALLLGTMYF